MCLYIKYFKLVCYIQREQVKKIKGRKELKDYGEEDLVKHEILLKRKLNLDLLDNPDPLFLYLKRYYNESGFFKN